MEMDYGQSVSVGGNLVFPDWSGSTNPQSTIENQVIVGTMTVNTTNIFGTYSSLGQPPEG
jgi:hypothetical protein